MEAGVDFVTPMASPPPQNTLPVVLITNELAIQSVALGLPSVYVDAQCDEGSHLFPVTDLSLIRPLEPKAALILTSAAAKTLAVTGEGRDGKKETRPEEKYFLTNAPFSQSLTDTHTHTRQTKQTLYHQSFREGMPFTKVVSWQSRSRLHGERQAVCFKTILYGINVPN